MRFNNFGNVLVLAPHTDDAELGCGGFIAELLSMGACVDYLVFSSADESLPHGFKKGTTRTEQYLAAKKLGVVEERVILKSFPVRHFGEFRQEILQAMINVRNSKDFDLVLLPCRGDVHQDHGVVSEEGIRAFKAVSILGYQMPWNNLVTESSCIARLSSSSVEAKVVALAEFKSQAHRVYMSPDYTRASAMVNGVNCGCEFAEIFEVVRWVIN